MFEQDVEGASFAQIKVIRSCFGRLRSVVQGDRYAKSQNADLSDPESCCKAVDQWYKSRFIDRNGSNKVYYTNVIKSYNLTRFDP